MLYTPHRQTYFLRSTEKLLFGRPFQDSPKGARSEEWHHRLHTDPTTERAYIPQSMLDRAVKNAIATMPNLTLPQRQNLRACIRVQNRIPLCTPLTLETYHVPLKGIPNTRPYISKTFPTFAQWEGFITIKYCTACTHTAQILDILHWCATHVGLGVWRPQVGGIYGTFEVESELSACGVQP